MGKISELLSDIAHRPWELPTDNWQYYQEWNKVLFFHWEVPLDILRKCVPASLNIDLFEGKAYVSLVAFTMEKIRPRNLPPVSIVSDFHEINLRTYIENDNKKGVYFLNIEAEKYLSAYIAKKISGLPYEKAEILRKGTTYLSGNTKKKQFLCVEFEPKGKLTKKTDLDKWLTERYCLYLEEKSRLFRFDVHHKEWEIRSMEVKKLNLSYQLEEINLGDKTPDLIHYSRGVQVVAWSKKLC